jgi:SAM-dependent methyltransferase
MGIIFNRVAPKFKFFIKEFRDKKFTLLDVGCGNNSATIAKNLFKNCRYFGVDYQNYNNNQIDFQLMEKFYEVNLSQDSLDEIPDNYFDVIMLTHVIEHISNGLEVVESLTTKLKDGGVFYIEYPSENSLNFPSMKGTLNFCDDESHIKLYSLIDVCNILLSKEFKIIRAGILRDRIKFFTLPFLVLFHCIKGTLSAGVFWYVIGFSQFIYARKKRVKETFIN